MGLNKRKLKGLIEYSDLRNTEGIYTEDDVVGVSTDKRMIPTKANLDGVNLNEYKLFKPGYFAFVADTSRRGDKIALAYNDTDRTYIVSTWYVVFFIKDSAKQILSSDYLYMYFNRSEFDRYARTNSWGSAREYFWFDDMEEITINLPPFDVQQKYVAIYNAMVANQQSYEHGLEDLKLTIEAQLEGLKATIERKRIGDFIAEYDEKNKDEALTEIQGVNKDKVFMPTVASGDDLTKYKIVPKNHFACNFMHVGRDVALPIALNDGDKPLLVSPAYSVYSVDAECVLAEYFLMWFSRDEAARNAWFLCDSSVRSGLERKRFLEIEIPVPPMQKQIILAKLHKALISRQRINEKMKAHVRDICPILIQGSIKEGGKDDHASTATY